jgi:hypothetical protein
MRGGEILAVFLIICGLILMAACRPTGEGAAGVNARDVGNSVVRIDDPERGVSCYRDYHRGGFSCVVTGVGP